MVTISNEIKEFVKRQKLGFVATVSPDNSPNLSPKGTIMVLDQDRMVFADIRSPNTLSNLKTNNKIEVNVVDPISRRGYRFKGNGSILASGKEYDSILEVYKKNGVESKINALIMIKIEEFSEVTSPLYDLGYTEAQIKTKMKNYYESF